jgi:D-sedoheptulose 7-phosphate isomerase
MDLASRINLHFEDNARAKAAAAEVLCFPLAEATDAMVHCLLGNGKILSCGIGGSAAMAQYFTSLLQGQFERERPELAAIDLTASMPAISAMANAHGWEQVFAKQVRALGHPGDVLLLISPRGDSVCALAAIEAAHERDLRVIALVGADGGQAAAMLRPGDVTICVPHERTSRIQEVHLLAIHCLCDGIDCLLMGDET